MSCYDDYEPEYNIETVETEEKQDTLKISCDLKILKEQIVNDIKYRVKDLVIKEIKKEVKEEIIDKDFKEILKKSISELLTQETLKIFDEGITISDGWGEKEETKQFRDLVKEQIKKTLNDKYSWRNDHYTKEFEKKVNDTIREEIEIQMKSITGDVKKDIQQVFNDVTKTQLSEAMFNMLMNNETYQKLNNSIKLLGK